MMPRQTPIKALYASMSQTPGLTSITQLIDTTGNEAFSFRDSTSAEGEFLPIVQPFPTARPPDTEE
jgi:hypothetical protein